MEYAIEHGTQRPAAGVGKLPMPVPARAGVASAGAARDAPGSSLVFGQRNLYYLRASPRTVIQMLLYLDPRHVDWMNDEGSDVLPAVMDILQPRIMPKLRAEFPLGREGGAAARTSRVEQVHTPDFKLAFFFRKVTSRHAVLLKDYMLYQPPPAPTTQATQHPVPVPPAAGHTAEPSSATDAAPVPEPATGAAAGRASGSRPGAATAQRHAAGQEGGDEDDELAALREAEDAEVRPPRVGGGGYGDRGDDGGGDGGRAGIEMGAEDGSGGASNGDSGGGAAHAPVHKHTVHVKQEDVDDNDEPLFLGVQAHASPAEDAGGPEGDLSSYSRGPGPAPLPPGTADLPARSDFDAAGGDAGEGLAEDVKPLVRVKYSGFGIYDKMLVVVVEPTRSTIERAPHLFSDEFLDMDANRDGDSLSSLKDRAAIRPSAGRDASATATAAAAAATPKPGVSGTATGKSSSRKRRLEQAWDEAGASAGPVAVGPGIGSGGGGRGKGRGGTRQLSATPYTAEERDAMRAIAEERERVRQASMRASIARRSESVRLGPLFRGSSQTPSGEAGWGWARTLTPARDVSFAPLPFGSDAAANRAQAGTPFLTSRGASVIPFGPGPGSGSGTGPAFGPTARGPSVLMGPPSTAPAAAAAAAAPDRSRSRYSRLSHSLSPTPGTGGENASDTTPARDRAYSCSAYSPGHLATEDGGDAEDGLPTLEEDSHAFELASQMLARPDVDEDDARALDEEEEE